MSKAKRGTVCIEVETEGQFPVAIIQYKRNRFSVTYGLQAKDGLTYSEAAHEFGLCVMHALTCAGKVDNG